MAKEEPRAYTADEMREQFLRHVWHLIQYWNTVEPNAGVLKDGLKRSIASEVTYTSRSKLAGLAFSILTLLDGGTFFPGSKVIPMPHPDDKEFHKPRGENWYPNDVDIGGYLHELFHNYDPRKEGE